MARLAATRTLFVNARVILPTRIIERGAVVVRDGRITAVSAKPPKLNEQDEVVDLRGAYLAPGYIDLHVHGGAGADFMDGTVEAVRVALRCHALHGTTTIFPTTTTGSPAQIDAMLEATRVARDEWLPTHGARITGVHLYGPFFAPDKVGCHASSGRRDPTAAEFASYFRDDLVRIATCAAELPGAAAFYRAARRRRCLITCGHSNATWGEMSAAFKQGMRHVDHFWCAMSSVASLRARHGTPMQASMEQFVLATSEMSTEIIADGYHLAPELLEFAWRMKGPERLCLVTDSNRALDQPPGKYRFGPLDDGSWFLHDGHVGRALNGIDLASSAAGLDHMVRTMAEQTSVPLVEIIRMASLTPATLTGIADDCGSIERGKRADLLVLDKRLQVSRVYLSGERLS